MKSRKNMLKSCRLDILKTWGFEGVELPSGLQHLHVRHWDVDFRIYKSKPWNIVTCGFYFRKKTGNVSKWVGQTKSWIWAIFVYVLYCLHYTLYLAYIYIRIYIYIYIHINWTCHLRADGRTSNSNENESTWAAKSATEVSPLYSHSFEGLTLPKGIWALAYGFLPQKLGAFVHM